MCQLLRNKLFEQLKQRDLRIFRSIAQAVSYQLRFQCREPNCHRVELQRACGATYPSHHHRARLREQLLYRGSEEGQYAPSADVLSRQALEDNFRHNKGQRFKEELKRALALGLVGL